MKIFLEIGSCFDEVENGEEEEEEKTVWMFVYIDSLTQCDSATVWDAHVS